MNMTKKEIEMTVNANCSKMALTIIRYNIKELYAVNKYKEAKLIRVKRAGLIDQYTYLVTI